MEPSRDCWADAEETAWCPKIRPIVVDYLKRQGVAHGRVGDIPASHLVPHVSIWAIESLARPGAIGWWVICGNLPMDYCSGHECRHPRLATRRIAESWHAALRDCKPGDKTIGVTGIPASFAPLLSPRARKCFWNSPMTAAFGQTRYTGDRRPGPQFLSEVASRYASPATPTMR
jgi:hypothetical protein